MEKPTKIALVGIAIGGVTAATGYIGLEYSKRRIANLVTACASESKQESVAVELWRNEDRIPGLGRMATVDDYAQWIVANKERKGTSEFEAVARAYKTLRDGPLVCDPVSLQYRRSELRLTAVQDKILEAQRGSNSWLERTLTLAIVVTLMSAIPYIWYFLLRRVREVRDAVVGK
jgi:hypothetical protein